MQFTTSRNRCCGQSAARSIRRPPSLVTWLLLGAVAMGGCAHAHHPYQRLSDRTTIRYLPFHYSALKPYPPTNCVVSSYAYGYQSTQWHSWIEDWGDQYEVLSPLPAEEGVVPSQPAPAQESSEPEPSEPQTSEPKASEPKPAAPKPAAEAPVEDAPPASAQPPGNGGASTRRIGGDDDSPNS